MAGFCWICLASPSAKASLIQATDLNFGPNSLTVDTRTGLSWLDLNYSAGMSYDETLGAIQPGGRFEGFRYASTQEVFDLLQSAGIPGTGHYRYYPLDDPAIQTFISLVGPTGSMWGEPILMGITGTSSFPGHNTVLVHPSYLSGDLVYLVGDYVSIGDQGADPRMGSWLVVPEPRTYTIVIVGLICLATCRMIAKRTFPSR